MSSADRSQYAEAVTSHSEGELREILGVAEPPISLLGGWAVHLHVTPGFEDTHGRSYIGSRDIDLGIPVDPKLSSEELIESEVATTFDRIESELGYHRGRFGFYQQFHRETGERLGDEAARNEPPHNVFRLDIDILPDTPNSMRSMKPLDFDRQLSRSSNPCLQTRLVNRSPITWIGTSQKECIFRLLPFWPR